MALKTSLNTFEHEKYYSMIDSDDPQIIPDLYAANIENFIIRNPGEIEMRDGLTAQGSSPSATNLGSGFLRKASGIKHLVRVINGAGNTSKFQYSDNGTTWIDISGGGSLLTNVVWHMVQANDVLYAVSSGQTSLKYDGSSITTVSAVPTGIAIEWWKNRLWVLDATTPDKLWFSNLNAPETYGGSDFVYINLGDGSPGRGLKGHPGQTGRLYIGKERSVWYLTGDDSSDFAVQPLTYEHGIASHESMLQVKNDVWCVDEQGRVRGLYRTTEDNPFSANRSEDINYTVSGINKVALSKASSVFFDNYAMFFLPNGVDDYNSIVLVYDTEANDDKGGWIKFTGWNIARATIYQSDRPRLYLHDARTANGQTYSWAGTSDNGTAITAKYETKIYDHKVPERKKKWKFAYQFAPALGSVSVKFFSSIDRNYYTLLKTFTLGGTDDNQWDVMNWDEGTWDDTGFIRQKIKFTDGGGMNHGYSNQVKIECTSSTTKIKVRKFTMHFRVLGLR